MEKTICLWLVSPKEFSLHSLNVGEKDLYQKIKSYRQQVLLSGEKVVHQARPEMPGQRIGRELCQLLMPEGVRRGLAPGQLLYIVPTGPLYALPFEALEIQGQGQAPRYLVEEQAVAYLSSASLLKVLRETQARRKEKPPHPLLAFAHPVYASQPVQEKSDLASLRRGAYRDLAGEAQELPETAEEVKEIQKLLQAPEASKPLNLREQASKARVLALHQENRLTDYRYLVFACHGLLPGEVTQLVQSALVLSNPEHEGYLTMGDVFGLKLNADLVTLSACNTGRGTPVKGEGVMGLTRAFMYAGTPAVSVTLWSVESLSAKDLNVGLHQHLSQGLGRAEALRRIKLSMLKGEKEDHYRYPLYWAPLVVFGDGQ
jgi:CHAT domain-containing protein